MGANWLRSTQPGTQVVCNDDFGSEIKRTLDTIIQNTFGLWHVSAE